jgi:hypothetical protein
MRSRRAYRRQIVQRYGNGGRQDCFAELLNDGRWLVSQGIHEVTVCNTYEAAVALAEKLARGEEHTEAK